MKNISFKYLTAALLLLTLSGCTDFFTVNTDNVLDYDDYIDEKSEMYAGFLGIVTQIQAIGDKSIYLTDTRAEPLEPTRNAPSELYALYQYQQDLTGNSYADPAPYYDIIISCNDYLLNMYKYKQNTSSSVINKTHYEGLIGSTVRVKAWVYLTLAKIYGEAVWFDDPLRENKDISQFELLDFDQVIQKCIELLDNGFAGVSSQADWNWNEYLDPNSSNSWDEYYSWDFMAPEYYALYSELALWADDFQTAANLVLNALNNAYYSNRSSGPSSTRNYLRNQSYKGKYDSEFWGYTIPYRPECVSVILYNYSKNQTNGLKKHFSRVAPNQYMLAPSEAGMARFSDDDFGNLGILDADPRGKITFTDNKDGYPYINKYPAARAEVSSSGRAASLTYQDDMCIYIYRGADLYFMLIEAMNGLGRFDVVEALMNPGVGGTFPQGNVQFDGFTDYWTRVTPNGTTTYPDEGIRSVWTGLGYRTMASDKEHNDMEILKEMMLEFAVEGKTLPHMIRMARRYGNDNIIADLVCPKYNNPEEIRSRILDKGYFIKWNYGLE